jgi:hypothetical protein
MAEQSPTIYANSNEPSWGRAIATAEHDDRREFVFEDGSRRTFLRTSRVIVTAVLEDEERASVLKLLTKKLPAAAIGKPKKKRAPKKKAAPAATE